jgi:hypothetical protein
MAAQALSLLWIGIEASAGSSYPSILPAFILGGLGMGIAFAPLSATVMTGMPAARQGEASGVYNTLRQLGGVFGVAILGAILQGIVQVPSQFTSGFHTTLRVAAGFLVLGTAASLLLPNGGTSGDRVANSEPGAPSAAARPAAAETSYF